MKNVKFVKGDIFESKIKDEIEKYFNRQIDVIISDMRSPIRAGKQIT